MDINQRKKVACFLNEAHELFQLGKIASALNNYYEALSICDAKEIDTIVFNMACCFSRIEVKKKAILYYQSLLELNISFYSLHKNCGNCYKDLGEYKSAVKQYKIALSLNENSEAFNNLGQVYLLIGRHLDALACFKQSIRRDSNNINAISNIIALFIQKRKLSWAISFFEKNKFRSLPAEAYLNMAVCHYKLGELRLANHFFEKSNQLKPMSDEGLWNFSLLLLQQNNYIEGFKLYESRLALIAHENSYAGVHANRLNSKNKVPPGSKVLVYWEQGIGDIIQFSRFINSLCSSLSDSRVTFLVKKELELLFKCSNLNAEIITNLSGLNFDFEIPLLSIPNYLSIDYSDITAPTAFNINLLTSFKNFLKKDTRQNLGIAWKGNPKHANDMLRSLSLEKMIKFMPENYNIYSIQKDVTSMEAELLEEFGVRNCSEMLNSMFDTAGLCIAFDKIITVDTSVAHLSGSLGIKTLLLLPYVSDWRWGVSGDSSIWYPCIKISRQASPNDWSIPLQEIKRFVE